MVRKVLPFQGAFHDILSVHRLYLLNSPVSMYKIKKKLHGHYFFKDFSSLFVCIKRSLSENYRKLQIKLRNCRIQISNRSPALWKKCEKGNSMNIFFKKT